MNRRTPLLLARMLSCPELGWRAGLTLVAAQAGRAVGIRRDVEVRLRRSRVWLGRDTFTTDWNVFVEIFAGRAYARVDYRGADVLDAGAHKGYFAAFALANGARTVTSLEPEPENFRLLARAAAGDEDWQVLRQAVAGAAGNAKEYRCLNATISPAVSAPVELICKRSNSRTEIASEMNSVSGPCISGVSAAFMA